MDPAFPKQQLAELTAYKVVNLGLTPQWSTKLLMSLLELEAPLSERLKSTN